ncbi:MAG TPA: hypothetical protein VIL74_15735 [Pyrinomonadaceae bacterium]|jgi:4-amino-4-deoxy-L-arabinose transferase-like glycosyltransferase
MKTQENPRTVVKDGDYLFSIRLGIGVLSVFFLAIIISRLTYPFDNGILEAYNWIPSSRLLAGENPYGAPFSPPYSMSPYGVVFYALIGTGIKIFGYQFWWGRLLSVAGFIVCLAAVRKIALRLTKSRPAAWAALLAGLAMFPGQFWIASMRSDLIAVAFAFSAVALAFAIEKNEKTPPARMAGMILLAGAAFFTKQTILLPVLIIFLRFFQLDKRRDAGFFALSFATLAVCGTLLLNYTSGGNYFWQHFTHAERLPHSWLDALGFFFWLLQLSVFFFALLFISIYLYRRGGLLYATRRVRLPNLWRSPKLLILLYFCLSLGWAFVSAGRVGANVNYYLENSFVAALLCGFVFDDFRARAARLPALAMVALLSLGGAYQMTRVLRGEYYRWEALDYYREIYDTAARLIPPGSACVSTNAELAVWNGCELHFDDFSEYSVGWSPELRAIFDREIGEGRYAAIFWSDDLSAQFPNYRPVPMSTSLPKMYYPVYLYVRAEQPAQ